MMIDGRSLHDHSTEVCLSVENVFYTKVRCTPARGPPTRLEVDESIWHDPTNALSPRHHSPAKQADVHRQVQKMLPLGIIDESQARYYSRHIPGRLKDTPEDLVHWMYGNDAQLKVDTAQVARGLAKLMTPTEETIQWMDDYHIPEEAVRDISRHHNAVVGHHVREYDETKMVPTVNKDLPRIQRVTLNADTLASMTRPWPKMREHVTRYVRRCAC